MVTERKKQLIDTIEVLANLVRVTHLRRALQKANGSPHLNFWILINNTLFDAAVLDWCKLFGSDSEERQPTHWKNVIKDHDRFRGELFAVLSVGQIEWENYWTEMKRYRDNAVAHHSEDRRKIPSFPRYELAIESAYFYYSQVKHLLLEECGTTQEPDDLKEYSKEFARQAEAIAARAVGATDDIREGVD